MTDRNLQSTTLEDLARHFLRESDESARLFLKQSWISHLVSTLRTARLAAGLTQADLAEKLGTTQSAIARLENDDKGSLSIRRMIDYTFACGMAPFDLSLERIEQLRDFALNDPDGERTERAFLKWHTSLPHDAERITQQGSLPTAPQARRDECIWESGFDEDHGSAALVSEPYEQILYDDQSVDPEHSSEVNAARRRWSDEEMNPTEFEPYFSEAVAA